MAAPSRVSRVLAILIALALGWLGASKLLQSPPGSTPHVLAAVVELLLAVLLVRWPGRRWVFAVSFCWSVAILVGGEIVYGSAECRCLGTSEPLAAAWRRLAAFAFLGASWLGLGD